MARWNWPPDLTPRMFFSDDQLEVRRNELRKHIARKVVPIAPVRYHDGDFAGAAAPNLDDSAWPVIQPHVRWTEKPDQLFWFRATVTVPADMAGKTLALRFGPAVARGSNSNNGESLLYLNGKPYHGVDRNHALIFLPQELCKAGSFPMAIQAWSGRVDYNALYWQDPELIWFDADTDALAYDFDAVYRTVKIADTNSPARIELIQLGEAALKAIDWTYPGSDRFYESVSRARAIMAEGLAGLKGQEGIKPVVNHIGHTHLDVAWLWTLENIKLKTARSWSSALRMMEQYPEFKWIQSQPQLYKYIKQTQPEIWEQVKQRVADGRWEAEGGMWVEADCNLSGGESLVRQFLHGQRFFREEFGINNSVLWLPDVFGYAWALPQIIKKSGLKYFMTTKISWSQFNKFPYDTFQWRGIDGTEVLTHYVTAVGQNQPKEFWMYTYNAEIYPDTVKGNWEVYQQKELNRETLSSFGYGDGGGGPTREMMEFARRLEDMPGIPQVKIGRVDEFFRRLDERVSDDPRTPVWNGELYLEYHRGTYTSQAKQKRNNRKSEFLLHNAELFAAAASALTGAAYPKAALDEAWEIVLRNQFHDIIPGTSIPEVYEVSTEEYKQVFALGGEAVGSATARLAHAANLAEESLVVFNPTGVERSDLVAVSLPEGVTPVDDGGEPLPVQGGLVYAKDVPANGWRAFPLRRVGTGPFADSGSVLATPAADTATALGALTVTDKLIETPHFRLELNEYGHITRLYDKAGQREVLAPGQAANVLQAFEDKPLRWENWDIEIYYSQKGRNVTDLVEATVEEAGPERGVLRLVWKFEGSTITQRLMVYARTPRIDFDTHVDWQQSEVLLKAAFPVDVHTTAATYEIQFGNVQRPTHWNTSWDWARFETCGHKWADLSEGGYGVSLLNDCKYGHDIKDNVMRLTLIKSGTWPDPKADRGEHRFTYSLYPHQEDWFRGGTVGQAYRLNNPLTALVEPAHPGTLPPVSSLVSCTAGNVMIETVKQAESGEGVVVRVYEFANRRGPAELVFDRPVTGAVETNLMEDEPAEVTFDGNRVKFAIKPYEIKTFVVRLRP
jgi:alpha-mannosidase